MGQWVVFSRCVVWDNELYLADVFYGTMSCVVWDNELFLADVLYGTMSCVQQMCCIFSVVYGTMSYAQQMISLRFSQTMVCVLLSTVETMAKCWRSCKQVRS